MSKQHETTGLEVEVSAEVLAGLEAARESGKYNMFDADRVADWCYTHGHPATWAWMRRHKGDYVSGIFNGFVAAPQPEAPEDEITEGPDPSFDRESNDDFFNRIDEWLRESNPLTLMRGLVVWLGDNGFLTDAVTPGEVEMFVVSYLKDRHID